jgi:hypothetical protein
MFTLLPRSGVICGAGACATGLGGGGGADCGAGAMGRETVDELAAEMFTSISPIKYNIAIH